jgi:hypothetical protein
MGMITTGSKTKIARINWNFTLDVIYRPTKCSLVGH